MKTWSVGISFSPVTVEVEAVDEKEAIKKAIDDLYNDPMYYLDLNENDKYIFDVWEE